MRLVFPATVAEPWIGPIDVKVVARRDDDDTCSPGGDDKCSPDRAGSFNALLCRRKSPEDAQTLSTSFPDNSIERSSTFACRQVTLYLPYKMLKRKNMFVLARLVAGEIGSSTSLVKNYNLRSPDSVTAG